MRRAIDGVHRGELPRQVSGLGRGRRYPRGDTSNCTMLPPEQDRTAASGHQVAPVGPRKVCAEVGERQLRGGRVRQHAEAGEHQQDVQQAAEREAGQDADRQIAPGITHLAG